MVVDRVQVFRGKWDSDARSGPFMGVREESLLAYTLRLPDEFIPWPGQELAETVLVDLDVGVSMSKPCWRWRQGADGKRVGGIDAELPEPTTWYPRTPALTASTFWTSTSTSWSLPMGVRRACLISTSSVMPVHWGNSHQHRRPTDADAGSGS